MEDKFIKSLRIQQCLIPTIMLFLPLVIWYFALSSIASVTDQFTTAQLNYLKNFLIFSITLSLIVVCGGSIGLFLFFEHLIKIYKETLKVKGWINLGRSYNSTIGLFLIFSIYPILRLIYGIFNYLLFPSSLNITLIVLPIFLLILLSGFILIFKKLSVKYKNTYMKIIKNFDLKSTIQLVENSLNKNNIKFLKLGKTKEGFLQVYDEIFEISENVSIKISSPYKEKRNKFLWPEKWKQSAITITEITSKNKDILMKLKKDVTLLEKELKVEDK